jgi:hypothetical protein
MSVSKTLTVPYHAAGGPLMDGAASVEMILESIGAAVGQPALDSTIQSNNIEPALWHADPSGVTGALNFHKPTGFGNHFVTYASPTAFAGSEKITYTLHQYQVATATLVFWGGMWLVVHGVQTDVDPLAGTPYVIEALWIQNPWTPPPGPAGDYVVYNPGWLNTYFTPVSVQHPNTGLTSQWNGQFISVCDPEPPRLGPQHLSAPRLGADGERLLDADEVVELTHEHIQNFDLRSEDVFRIGLDGAESSRPELVNRLDHPNVFEYIVPFAKEGSTTTLLRVDARFGCLLEAASYPQGIQFPQLTADDIRDRLMHDTLDTTEWLIEGRHMGLRFREAKRLFKDLWCLYPTLVWLPCWESRSPLYPFYMVSIGSQRLYISSWDGTIYSRLRPFGPSGTQRPGGI